MTTRSLVYGALFIVVLLPVRAKACTCAWMGPLLTVAPRAEAIIRARVLGYHGRSRGVDLAMDVEVQEVFKGSAKAKRIIRVWGDNGSQCRPYVSGFPVQTEWIFAISELKSGNGRAGDYFIHGCGEYWAKIENGDVAGRLTSPSPPNVADTPERMSLTEFRKKITAKTR